MILIESRLKLLSENNDKIDKSVKEMIGCLIFMYLMLGSRSDLSFTINFFSVELS